VYLPCPENGHVSNFDVGGYNSTEYGILQTAEEHVVRGQTEMFLASCSYMLKPLIQVLRKSGIPFHNPYCNSNEFWNPLRLGRRGSTPTSPVRYLRDPGCALATRTSQRGVMIERRNSPLPPVRARHRRSAGLARAARGVTTLKGVLDLRASHLPLHGRGL
jgi:hypothetical protein